MEITEGAITPSHVLQIMYNTMNPKDVSLMIQFWNKTIFQNRHCHHINETTIFFWPCMVNQFFFYFFIFYFINTYTT